MHMVISRFRVRNGMEDEVQRAFRDRPRLVEKAPGFLGMDVHTDADDPTIFYLATRWASGRDYDSWHKSHSYRDSHAGIPKGLKLDPGFTKIFRMDRFHPEGAAGGEVLAEFSRISRALHHLSLDRHGAIRSANAAASRWLGRKEEELRGEPIQRFCASQDDETIRNMIEGEEPLSAEIFISLVDRSDRPYTLQGFFSREGGEIVLLGTPEAHSLHDLQEQMLAANNQLAEMARESERRRRELERTKTELESTYWHLKKIQEVLPICMGCEKVKTGEAEWQSVVDYLKKNALFLSHGYCPDCRDKVFAEYGMSRGKGRTA